MRRLSKRKARKRHMRKRRGAERVSFPQALQYFLTPQVFKQGHQAWQTTHQKNCAWSLKAIIWVLFSMVWGKGDSLAERFLAARAFYVSQHAHEKRPGDTCEGFQQALRRLPIPVFRALAAGLRTAVGRDWLDQLRIGGWLPMGCDGSRLECPRSEALEQRFGEAGKEDSAPTLYLSALVLLPIGLLWAWRLDKGTASEHRQLRQLLPTLPEQTLLVADAGYVSYQLYRALVDAGHGFLIRMSSRAYLLSDKQVALPRFREGWVYYWPREAQQKGEPPIRARLLRVRGKGGDVWLLTTLDRSALSRKHAAQVYRWRWRNEGLFRTYKQTLHKIKLEHRTPALIFREAEGSLLALQLLLALSVQTLEAEGQAQASPRATLLRIRGALERGVAAMGPRQRERYERALAALHGDFPNRRSSKTRRPWPRRKPHKPPKPPQVRTLTDKQKERLRKVLRNKKAKKY